MTFKNCRGSLYSKQSRCYPICYYYMQSEHCYSNMSNHKGKVSSHKLYMKLFSCFKFQFQMSVLKYYSYYYYQPRNLLITSLLLEMKLNRVTDSMMSDQRLSKYDLGADCDRQQNGATALTQLVHAFTKCLIQYVTMI